jgi:hypothetical protein
MAGLIRLPMTQRFRHPGRATLFRLDGPLSDEG